MMYDVYNGYTKVARLEASQARYALADFLTQGLGDPRVMHEQIVRDANQPSTRGSAAYQGYTAVPTSAA